MAGGFSTDSGCGDLLGSPRATATVPNDMFSTAISEPGKMLDLSGTSKLPPLASGSSSKASSNGGGSGGSATSSSSSFTPAGPPWDRGPSSIEGGGSGLSLAGLSPANIMRQLASRPMTELVREHGQLLLQLPRVAANAYAGTAHRYLRPWRDFLSLRPGRIIEAFRGAQRRGEIQIYVQRNVIANTRQFCPNYIFGFLATLFMFVCTSPMLLGMLSLVGGGWSHALRSEQFRNRPWQLQIGGLQIPLGQNLKMLMMALPTLIFLHFFMGPVLWSAALCSGGVSAAHAALKDRDDEHPEDDDHGLGSDGNREVV